jgi:hypothetical protein
MKAYEFKSVIEARQQVEDQFKFFREMMTEKNRSSKHTKEQLAQRKQFETEDQHRR